MIKVYYEEDDSGKVEPRHFIEETGKTGVVDLCHLAPPEILAKMVAGDKVYLKIEGSNLVVGNGLGEFSGADNNKIDSEEE